jgi:hypothetical protein
MSHADYIAGCDEDQLKRLVEMANERITKIRESGWVKLWTVNVSWANVAWFVEEDHQKAVDYVCRAVKKAGEKAPGKGIEVQLSLERYRPEEVAGLIATKEA